MAVAAPPSAWGFGEEDQDFSFEDQLAEEDSFEADEERWAAFAADQLAEEGPPRENPVGRQAGSVHLPVDELASQQAASGKCACIHTISLITYSFLICFEMDPDLFRSMLNKEN